MTTKNLIPRADGEGGIGIDGAAWASGVFNTGIFVDSVGIGTASPDRLLDVENSDGNAFISIVGKNDSRTAILLGDADSDNQGRIDYDNSDDHLHFSTAGKEHMRINSLGNIGIGTTEPDSILELASDSSPEIIFSDSTAGDRGSIDFQDGDFRFWSNYTDQGAVAGFATNNFTISKSGDVGIGIMSPNEALHVNGNIQLNNWVRTIGDMIISADFDDNNSDSAIRFNIDGNDIADEKMRIDSDGNVGIGTTNPIAKLHVNGGALNNQAIFESIDEVSSVLFKDPNGTAEFGNRGNAAIIMPAGVEKMRIDSDGNVGIGTTNPDSKLHLSTTGLDGLQLSVDSQSYYHMIRPNGDSLYIGADEDSSGGSGADIRLNIKGDEKMRIDSNGNVGIGTTSPIGKLSIEGSSASSYQTHITFNNTSGSKDFAIGAGIHGTTNEGFGILDRNTNAPLLYINNSGDIGIGTTNPSHTLEVRSPSVDQTASILIAEGDGDTGGFKLTTNTTSTYRTTVTHDDVGLVFNTSPVRPYCFMDGNVGIGTTSPAAKLDVQGDISISGAIVSSDSDGRVLFSDEGLMVGQAAVKPDPDNPESLYFQAIPQVKDTEGNAVTVLTADKLGLGTSAVLESADQDLQFKLLTDENRFVVGTSGNAENTIASGWYRFNDFKVKGATDIGSHPINPVDTRIYSDESSFILFKNDTAGNRVAHLVGGDEAVSPNNAIALGIAVKVDSSESPKDIEFVHTDGESYSVINGNSDSLGTNGLPVRQGFQSPSLGSNPVPLLIDGGSF